MFNDIKLGPVTLHMYGLMIACGFFAALMLCLKRGRKRNLDPDIVWGIFYCAIFGGLLGARLLFLIVELPNVLKDPSIIWNFGNGYVVYGGIIGGILTAWAYCRWKKKVGFLQYLDLMLPGVSLGQAFGRIGCFCAGCCYGRETDSVFGIVFTNSNFAPNGVKLIPTQLISSGLDALLCLFLLWFASRNPKTGKVSSAWLMLYGIGRFLLEFLRNDYRGSVGIFSTSQFVSLGIVAIGVILCIATGKMDAKGKDENSQEASATEESKTEE